MVYFAIHFNEAAKRLNENIIRCDGKNFATARRLSLGVVNKAHPGTDLQVY